MLKLISLDFVNTLQCIEALWVCAFGSGCISSSDLCTSMSMAAWGDRAGPWLCTVLLSRKNDRPQLLPLSCLVFRWKQQPEFCVWCLSTQGGQQHQLEPQPPAERVPEPRTHLRLPDRWLPAPDPGPGNPRGWVSGPRMSISWPRKSTSCSCHFSSE